MYNDLKTFGKSLWEVSRKCGYNVVYAINKLTKGVIKMIGKILNNRGAWIFAALIVAGVVILVESTRDSAAMAKGITDFNTMTEADFIEGRFVQGTIYDLWDEFAYEEEYQSTFGIKHNERVAAHYYLMPLQTSYDSEMPVFIAVCIGNTEAAATAQQMIDEYWDYIENDNEPDVWTELPITGKVEKLDGEIEQFFYEYFTDAGMSREEADELICPYVIRYHVLSAASSGIGISVVIMIIGIVGIAGIIIYYLKQDRDAATAFTGSFNASAPFPQGGYEPASSGSMNNTSGYEPVGSRTNSAATGNASAANSTAAPAGSVSSMDEISVPDVSAPQTMDMDSIDTSGLGIGIGDDD